MKSLTIMLLTVVSVNACSGGDARLTSENCAAEIKARTARFVEEVHALSDRALAKQAALRMRLDAGEHVPAKCQRDYDELQKMYYRFSQR